MRLDRPFLKLPVEFDSQRLAAEVRALPKSAWTPHPTGFVGNEAVRLVSPGGRETDDLHGEMAPTANLLACPYVMEVMGAIGGVWGRSRFMGLGAGGEVPRHLDTHYYWRTHWRIHIPVITNPKVTFTCGPETVHMGEGECWLFDSFRWHRVENGGDEQRVHLVLDTVGGAPLRELMQLARENAPVTKIAPTGELRPLAFEKMNSPKVMSPWELREHLRFLRDESLPHPALDRVFGRLDAFAEDWAAAWAQFGADGSGFESYLPLLEAVKADLGSAGGSEILLNNRLPMYVALDDIVFLNLLAEVGDAGARASQAA